MKRKIMVVEDEQNMRLLLEEELADEGYDVASASNAEEALKLFESDQDIDLATIDIEMPGISGLELAGRLRKSNLDMKIILLTAYTHYKQDLSSWAADAYVVKSMDLTELKSKIRDLLRA